MYWKLFSILQLIRKLHDRTRFADVSGSAEGRFNDLQLMMPVEWFPYGMVEGIVDEERPLPKLLLVLAGGYAQLRIIFLFSHFFFDFDHKMIYHLLLCKQY